VATLGVLGPLVWFWQDGLVPASYSVMDMGYVDDGGGPRPTGSDAMVGMDHKHASQGMVAHLMYAGVTTPYKIGGEIGNDPE
jgi:hypothetical protein